MNICLKGYKPNSGEKVTVIKEVKDTYRWIYVTKNLDGNEITETEIIWARDAKDKLVRVSNWKGDKDKSDEVYVKWKFLIINLIVRLMTIERYDCNWIFSKSYSLW